jgi:diguanylate cyclase (GGDEF)-like protein
MKFMLKFILEFKIKSLLKVEFLHSEGMGGMITLNALLIRAFKIFSLCMIVMIVSLMLAFPILTAIQTMNVKKTVSAKGHIDLTGFDLDGALPVALDGEWELFPNLYLETYDREALFSPIRFLLPFGTFTHIYDDYTFRLYIKTNTAHEDLALFIRGLKHDMRIWVNGVLQPSLSNIKKNEQTIIHKLKIDKTLPEQEIILSFSNTSGENPLYSRTIYLGTEKCVITYFNKTVNEAIFTFGILIILILFGNIFMFLHPDHKTLSFITMLDTAISFRIIFKLTDAIDFIQLQFGNFRLTDSFLFSMQLFSLMIGGVFGTLLAKKLFDEENKIPRFFSVTLPIVFGAMAVFFPVNVSMFTKIGLPILVCLFVATVAVIIPQSYVYWKNNKNSYALFQIIKTYYFCAVVAFDVLTIKQKVSPTILIFSYMPFFLAHIFTRLIDSKQSYAAAEHTIELMRTNRTLSEIATRDPLTAAYNRIFVDETFNKILNDIDQEKVSLHLCIFDLDHFKIINDRYGHDEGDEHLKFIADTAREIIGVDERVLFARIGGDEFVLLFKGMFDEEVMKVLESIQFKLELSAQKEPRRTTASFGVALLQAGMTQKDLFKLADKNMYQSKSAGGNRITFNCGEK